MSDTTNTQPSSEITRNILSDITIYSKYAKYLPDVKRREVWTELVDRNQEMHINKFKHLGVEFIEEIITAYDLVKDKKVLPSMRSLQFSGKPIELSPNRLYNCSFTPCDNVAVFSETMFLLLGGSGVGFSVQKHDIAKLPEILGVKKRTKRFLIGDSIEGWADSVKVLVEAYFFNKCLPVFDFGDIRPRGTILKTSGGKAPGPQPLKDCLHNVTKVFNVAIEKRGTGTKLTSLEVHDIQCYIADAVLAGGIRRAALISLFTFDDDLMLSAKCGNWFELNPQRARANNSAVVLRHKIKNKEFLEFWKKVEASRAGEPGIFFTNDKSYGANPSLRAGTKVITKNGIYPIEELQDKQFMVPNLDGSWNDAKCWKSGTDISLWKLTFDDGRVYYSSPQHNWPIYTNDRYIKCRSDELKIGDMMPINTFNRDKLFDGKDGNYDIGLTIGWLYGDGCLTLRSDSNNYVASFVFSKNDTEVIPLILKTIKEIDGVDRSLVERESTYEFQVGSNDFISTIMNKYSVNKKEFGLPKKLWTDWSDEMIRGFIDGLFSSDGHVPNDSHGISLSSSRVNLINDVQELLGFYGIKSKIYYRKLTNVKFPNGKTYDRSYDSYILRTTLSGRIKFSELFNLSISKKQLICKIEGNKNNINQKFMILKSIELTDLKEDVWDISVSDSTHCFQLSTVTTGNCNEISLKANQFCNVTTINGGDISSQQDLNERVRAASFIGTLQASYTDFHYLREVWKETTEKEALLGVSITGITSGELAKYNLTEAATVVVDENRRVANIIGINPAARTTCIKPEGTSSLVLGCSSGIHAWHAPYYIRRLRLYKEEQLYKYLKDALPELIEDDILRPDNDAVLSIPIMAPKNAVMRTEPALDLLERGKKFFKEWIAPGHIDGQNTHNVSITVSVKDDEWDIIGEWMWNNRKFYNGIAVLPYYGGNYKQAPFEDCDEETYTKLLAYVSKIDLRQVIEVEDNTQLSDNLACSGGSCSIERV